MASPNTIALDIPCRGLPVLSLYSQGTLRGSTIALDVPSRGGPVLDLYVSPLPVTLSASMTGLSGSLSRSTARSLSAALTGLAGALSKSTARALSAAMSPSADLTRDVSRGLEATVSLSTDLTRTLSREFQATIAPTAGLARTILRALEASLTLTATVAGAFTRHVYEMTFDASLAFAATVSKTTTRALDAVLAPTAAVQRATRRSLAASLPLRATLTRRTQRTLAAVLTPAAGLTRRTRRALEAALVPTAEVARGIRRAFTAQVRATTSVQRQTLRSFAAALPLRGPRYVALFRPVLRYTLVLPQRASQVVAGARDHLFLRPAHAAMWVRPGRTRVFYKKEDVMKLVPSGASGAEPEIAPDEANLDFTAEFKDDIPTNVGIASFQVTASRLGSPDDITNEFVAHTSQTGTKVTAIVGKGDQDLHAVYRLRYKVTLTNSPPSTLVGILDIECKDKD